MNYQNEQRINAEQQMKLVSEIKKINADNKIALKAEAEIKAVAAKTIINNVRNERLKADADLKSYTVEIKNHMLNETRSNAQANAQAKANAQARKERMRERMDKQQNNLISQFKNNVNSNPKSYNEQIDHNLVIQLHKNAKAKAEAYATERKKRALEQFRLINLAEAKIQAETKAYAEKKKHALEQLHLKTKALSIIPPKTMNTTNETRLTTITNKDKLENNLNKNLIGITFMILGRVYVIQYVQYHKNINSYLVYFRPSIILHQSINKYTQTYTMGIRRLFEYIDNTVLRQLDIPIKYNFLKDLVVIHIGKCGGSTVCKELEKNNIKHKEIHIVKPIYEPNKKYIIVIRNPIKRFISAFNWRYHLVNNNKLERIRFKKETEIINKYKNVDNLCIDLENNPNIFNGWRESNNYIHHLKEDINFYLNKFVHECPKYQIAGVICTETLNNDMKHYFDIDVINHEKKNSIYSRNISDKSYKILKEYLKKDYLIINQMYKNGWITFKKYKLLIE